MRRLADLRTYLNALRDIGEVQEIDQEVDWDLEIGAITRRSYELRAPAPLFNRIKGIEPGFRALGAPSGISRQPGLKYARIALALGLDPHSSGRDIVEAIARARSAPGIKPRVVPTGPCKENVLLGDAVDLLRLPSPVPHGGDGGRYVNTYGCIAVRTPDGGWTNWSIARIMLIDRNRMTGLVPPGQHIGMIHKMWVDKGEDMPFAVAMGVEPAVPYVCGMPAPENMDEADLLGAYFGEGVEAVRCETNDLLVPATAEIVLEGVVSASEKAPEGPMGEFAGYNFGEASPKPVYHVRAMTFRNDPILPVAVAGEPVEDDHTTWGVPNAAEALALLREAGLPVTMCWGTLESANHWLVVTVAQDWRDRTVIKKSEMMCHRIGEVIFSAHGGAGLVKVIVLEDDVDPTDTNEVVWAFATRAHPGSSEILFPNEQAGMPRIYLEPDEKRTMRSPKAVYDCLTSDKWTNGKKPRRTNLALGYPPEIRDRVLKNWNAYGYAEDEQR